MQHYRNTPVHSAEPKLAVDLPCDTGEGPLWDKRTHSLTWNDIPVGTLYRYTPETGINEIVYQHNSAIGGHTLQRDGSFLLFCSDGEILRLNNGETETLHATIEAVVGSRFNDVAAGPRGEVFCGTMPLKAGPAHFYRLNHDGSLDLVWDDLGLSNGIGFCPLERTMYLSDSDNRVIYRADYDRDTGEVSNREVFITLHDNEAVPDGLTVDATGDLWVAVWDGRCVLHYSAEGDLIDRINMPVKKVSSINFGGERYDIAFITTAGGPNRSEDEGPLAGSLFTADIPAVRGKPEYLSRINIG